MEWKARRRAALTLLALLVACATGRAQAPNRARPSSTPPPKTQGGADAAAPEAGRLVYPLERHPAKPSTAANHVAGLFVLDIAKGRATLIADEPDPGVGYCGCPAWSSDGKRIIFDAMNADQVAQAHIKVIE